MAVAIVLRGRRSLDFRSLVAGSWLHSRFSTSTRLCESSKVPKSGSKIYEMRTYYVKPKAFAADFLKLTNEYVHLKTESKYSKLNGCWTTDIGGINEAVHIWEYDSFAQRTEAKQAMSQDQTWINDYVKKMLNMLVKQDNVVMNAVPWFDVKPPMSTGGVYELRMYDILLGKKDQFEHRFIQGLPDRCKVSEPAGIWFTEFGPVNTAVLLWPYLSLDDRTRIRHEAQQLEEWVEAVRDCSSFIKQAVSKVLIPTDFSPWR
ncbi:protein NipSnap homolog isoform X1 [Montipora capricornis]|uniref:protein NipSnap homolog isoform X1 n=1 Tax=Montipora capricornis TaxID=246305 RepID=UPI0035F1B6D9